MFRAVRKNAALLDTGIDGNPNAMSVDQLKAAAWRAVEPHYLDRLTALSSACSDALAQQKATADLAGAVVIVPEDRRPSQSGLAAIRRY